MERNEGQSISSGQTLLSDRTVLLVDDNKVNQFLGKRILSNLGLTQIDVASSGEEAFTKVSSSAFDIILTDVEMPGMTGYDLCRKIRAYESGGRRHIVIALTANASDEDRAHAEAAGIDDYLTKPYSPQDLLEVLQKNAGNARPLVMEEMNDGSEYGIEKVYAVFNHQQTDVLQFLKMLQQQLPVLVQEIRDGLTAGPSEKAFNAAHKLKSPVKLLTNAEFCERFSQFTETLRNTLEPVNITAFADFDQELNTVMMLINAEIEKSQS